MASPPAMNGVMVPAVRSSRAVLPSFAMAAFSWSSFAPVTVLSAVTTTWCAAVSTPHDVPGIAADRSSAAMDAWSVVAL